MSETQLARPYLEKYCTGCGLDVGCGDDLIVPWAIGIDRRQLGKTNIVGDVRYLQTWFANRSMDFVFSSHCLEDFDDTTGVLSEWFWVLKRDGLLVLFLPDQQLYEAHCKQHGTIPNQDHKHPDFSLEYMKQCLSKFGLKQDSILFEQFPIGAYSFALVVRKDW